MILALDLSKKRTGWAWWDGKSDRPRYGSEQMGSEFTPMAGNFVNIHKLLEHLNTLFDIQYVYIEAPINPASFDNSKKETRRAMQNPFVLIGLAAHALSWCEVRNIKKYDMINQAKWKRLFLGAMPFTLQRVPKIKRSGNYVKNDGSVDWKKLSVEKANELGLRVKNDDEADAIGLLSYAATLHSLEAPWLKAVEAPLFADKPNG